MNKIFKYFAIGIVCFAACMYSRSSTAETYKPELPVEKVNKSLSVVEKKVRDAAVKVMTSSGHGSGTVVQYKDLVLVLTAKHVADGPLGSEYLISQKSEQRTGTLIYQSANHDIAVLVVSKSFHHLKPMSWKPTGNYDIGADIIYSGHPSWHKLMSFEGRIVGYEEIPGTGTHLIINTYGWFGCSGAGVYNTNGELVGILYGIDVQYTYGTQIQENMIWVAPIKNIDIKEALKPFCRGTVQNYKACR
jgi:S1-C subfamily serine protease